MNLPNFKTFSTVSDAVRKQIDTVCGIWKNHLGEQLVGVYVHGSLALGRFIENKSDIDMLTVVNRHIGRSERLEIAREIIDTDKSPCPLEMSAVMFDDLKPWKYPTPCVFHYSDYWTARYMALLNGELKDCFIVDSDFPDADIACHAKLTRLYGVCVYGEAIETIFPEVPNADFIDSICADIDEYDFHAYEPRYFASNILTLGRILSYMVEKRILSKYDGGLWTRSHVPENLCYIVSDAVEVWYGSKTPDEYNAEDLTALRNYLINNIKRYKND